MPLYEYQCSKCGHRFEKIESSNASTRKKCPKCGGNATRVLTAPAIQFKGSGWYVTDYSGKSGGGDSKKTESPSAETAKAAATDSAPQKDSKPAKKEKS